MLFVEICRRYLEQGLAVRLFNRRPFEGKLPDVLQQLALILIFQSKLGQLLRVEILQEFCVIALKERKMERRWDT